MMILYLIGNTNLSTVRVVSRAIGEKLLSSSNVQKIFIFNTTESSNYQNQQAGIYRNEFGDRIRIEEVIIDDFGLIEAQVLTHVFQEEGEKIVDITNGKKTTAALLYFAASLVDVKTITYLQLLSKPNEIGSKPVKGIDYELTDMRSHESLIDFARINRFDLIFYIKEVDSIFYGTNRSIAHLRDDLKKGIVDFFVSDSPRSTISNVATCEEVVRNKLYEFLQNYSDSVSFAANNGVNWNQVNDPVGGISWFFSKFSRTGQSNPNLSPLVPIGGILSALRNYRNLAAHSGKNAHKFTEHEARISVNLAIELLRTAKASGDFWSYLNK